jgi:hypothetical protein
MDIARDRLYVSFEGAYKATAEFLEHDSALHAKFDDLHFFASQILTECYPSDFESIKKMWWFPIVEAGLELEYSLFFAKAGIYKVAHMSLRNFLELSLTCFHFLLMKEAKGNEWVRGHVPTPFKRGILNVLLDNEDFFKLDRYIAIKDRIESAYRLLSDICHTRGQPSSHMTLSKANYPRFIEESLRRYIQTTQDVVDIVITCFVAVNPIILYPTPIEEKFGINGPMSGYLQEYQVERLRRLLKPASLEHLLHYYDSDPGVKSLREYFEGLPDITEDEFKKQLEDFDRFIKEMNAQSVQQPSPGDSSKAADGLTETPDS